MVELIFLMIGISALGYYVYVQSDTYLFQAYQSWRLEQLQHGKPATITRYLKEWVPNPWDNGAVTSPGSSAERGSNPHTPGPVGSGTDSNARPGAIPRKSEGELIGKIEIPKLKLSAVILEGIQPETLRVAVGHLPGTALPGDSGNVELAGHRDTFFRGLRHVQKGDSITLSTVSGATHDYRVESLAVVSPNNTDVLNASPGPGLDLITCYPFYYVGAAPKRFVVYAAEVKDSASAINRGRGDQEVKGSVARSAPMEVAQNDQHPKPPLHHNSRLGNHRASHHRSQHSLRNASASRPQDKKAGEDSASLSDESVASGLNSPNDAASPRPVFDRVRTFFRRVIKWKSVDPATPSESSTGS